MPTYVVKFWKGEVPYYLMWSSVVDAPVSMGMPLEKFRKWYAEEEGEGLDGRLARVEKTGTSAVDGTTTEELVAGNRAGPNESHLTYEQIVEVYCR